jgi:hypothetical protein
MAEPPSGTAELYGLDPDEFTAARNALVRQLRPQDRAAADAVAALRRPPLTAWALNQLARYDTELVDALVDAGAALAEAMDQALAGDRSGVAGAQRGVRDAVEAAIAGAEAHLDRRGSPVGDAARQRMGQTLHAVTVDDDLAGQLRAGTLADDAVASGFGGGFGAGAGPSAPARPRSTARAAKRTPAKGGDAEEVARREREAAEARHAELSAEADRLTTEAGRLATQADEAHQRIGEAERALSEARRAADTAARAATDAERSAARARRAADAARPD